MTKPFEMGIYSTTAQVDADIPRAEILKFFERHKSGDFGKLDTHDVHVNTSAITYGTRIMSEYEWQGRKLFLITEADRSRSTLLYADEY